MQGGEEEGEENCLCLIILPEIIAICLWNSQPIEEVNGTGVERLSVLLLLLLCCRLFPDSFHHNGGKIEMQLHF